MMCHGTEEGVLSLLESKPESCWLSVRGALEVLDAVPRDRVEPFQVHDLLIQSKGLFTTEHAQFIVCRCSGGLSTALREGEEDL